MALETVLNVGGGSKSVAISAHFGQWRHDLLDVDRAGRPDIVMDARELGTLAAGNYDAVYCSHNLEHYHRHDVAKVVRGFSHVLKDDGFAEIHVPDVGGVMRHVVEKQMDIDDVLYVAPAGPILVRDVLYGYHVEIEQSGQEFYAHKTGFTDKALARMMAENGFPVNAMWARNPFEVSGYFFKRAPGEARMKMLGLKAG